MLLLASVTVTLIECRVHLDSWSDSSERLRPAIRAATGGGDCPRIDMLRNHISFSVIVEGGSCYRVKHHYMN
jgi:hypothetical protein